MHVDAVILDIDGVLVDVSNSYRRAIIETINRLYGERISDTAIQAFKDAGGFNNDWELTDAAALYVLARRRGYQTDIDAFTRAIADRGGGLPGAKAVLSDRIEQLDPILNDWNPEEIRSIFQALYLGEELYRELEGGEPVVQSHGYIYDEPTLIDPETVQLLTEQFSVGVLTGRPAAEASIALDRVGLDIMSTFRVTMDDAVPGKPAADGLLLLADRLSAQAVVFVGDTLDDIRTVLNAKSDDAETDYYSIGVLTGGLTGDAGRKAYEDVGADRVTQSVNELPDILSVY